MGDMEGLSFWVPKAAPGGIYKDEYSKTVEVDGAKYEAEVFADMAKAHRRDTEVMALESNRQLYAGEVRAFKATPWYKRALWRVRIRLQWIIEGLRVMWRGPREEDCE